MPPKKNILLTGRPRVGKSTLIRKVVERLKELGYKNIGGFYTLEVRKEGERAGFSINTLNGKTGRLAEAGFESRFRLGRYGIDMESFEGVAVKALADAIDKADLIAIDEIGFMELKSRRFRELLIKALDSPKPVIATIMRSRYEFVDRIKEREDTETMVVRVENRDGLLGEVVERVRGMV